MKLWPFSKKPDEVEALSTDCELPAGVMLASPTENMAPPAPTVPSYHAPGLSTNPVDPAAHLASPPATSRLEQLEAAEALELSQSLDLLLPQGNLPPFSLQLETVPTQNNIPPFMPDGSATVSSLSPSLNLQFDQWQAPEPTAQAQPLLNQSTVPSTIPAAFNLEPNSLISDTLTPPPLGQADLAGDWALSFSEAAPALPSQGHDFSPFPLELSPPNDDFSPLSLTNDSLATSSLDFSNLSPDPSAQSAPVPEGLSALLCPEPLPESLPPKNSIPPKSVELAPIFQGSLMETMVPPPLPPLTDLAADTQQATPSFDEADFGLAPTWELEPPPIPGANQLAPPEQGMPAELAMSFSQEPDDSGNGWCNAEDQAPESAELNSSGAAYDLNHYDDPDEPSPAFELQNHDESAMPEGDLQALANRLSQSSSYEAAQSPETSAFMYAGEAKTDDWGMLGTAADHDVELEQQRETLADFSTGHVGHGAEPLEMTEPTQFSAHWEAAEAVEPVDESPMPLASLPLPQEEQPMPKSSPSSLPKPPPPTMDEALPAKFIARSKPETQSTAQPLAATHLIEPAFPSSSASGPSLLEPLSLPSGKARSLSQALDSFEQEILLKETRFVKQSINNLVDRYFAQQEPDNSW